MIYFRYLKHFNFYDFQLLPILTIYSVPYNSFCRCPRVVLVKTMDSGIVVSDFELQSCYYFYFKTNTLVKGLNLHIIPAMGFIISLLFFYKDGFGVKYPTQFDMSLNNLTICCFFFLVFFNFPSVFLWSIYLIFFTQSLLLLFLSFSLLCCLIIFCWSWYCNPRFCE